MARQAGPEDVPSLVRLINTAFRVEDFFVLGDRTTDQDIRARLEAPGAAFLVIDSPVAGELAAAVFVETHGKRGHFALLAVDPARQKQGLGRALVDAVEAHCRSAGCEALDLDIVNLREELPAFYSGLGYVATGTSAFPDPQKLRRDAHFVSMTKPLA